MGRAEIQSRFFSVRLEAGKSYVALILERTFGYVKKLAGIGINEYDIDIRTGENRAQQVNRAAVDGEIANVAGNMSVEQRNFFFSAASLLLIPAVEVGELNCHNQANRPTASMTH